MLQILGCKYVTIFTDFGSSVFSIYVWIGGLMSWRVWRLLPRRLGLC